MISFSFPFLKNRVFYSMVAASSLALLVSCSGGGGGGGSGSTNITMTNTPIAGTTLNRSSPNIEVEFVEGKDVDPDTLSVKVNGVEVGGLFEVTDEGASVSMFRLLSVLKDGENTLEVDVAKSAPLKVKFFFDAAPEIIHTGFAGGTVNGVVRLVDLQSALLNAASMNVSGKSFSLGGVTLPAPRSNVSTADYTLTVTDADGDADTAYFVVPQTTLKAGVAVQANNSAFTVLEGWIGEVMGRLLSELDTSDVLKSPHVGDASSAYDDTGIMTLVDPSTQVCVIIPGSTIPSGEQAYCKLFVTDISFTGNTTVDAKVLPQASGSPADQKFRVEVSVLMDQIDITLDVAAYSSLIPGMVNYEGALISTISYQNVGFKMVFDAQYDAAKLVKFTLPDPVGGNSTAFSFELGTLSAITNTSCSVCTSSNVEAALEDALDVAEATIEQAAANALEAELAADVDEVMVAVSPSNVSKVLPVNGLANPIHMEINGSDVSESNGNSGAFVALGGTVYAEEVDSGSFNPVIGSYFDPLNATMISQRNITTTDHIGIAISENMLNQWLMAVYQSGVISNRSIKMEVGDLGAIGDTLVTSSAGVIHADDEVIITLDLRALPSVQFTKGSTTPPVVLPSLELSMDSLNIGITVKADTQDFVSDILVDVRALLSYGLGTNKMPVANVSPKNVVVRVVSVSGAAASVITADKAQAALPDFLATYIKEKSGQVFGSSTFNFDLKGLKLQKKSWLVLKSLKVDDKEEYIVLTADITDVAPTGGVEALYVVEITDSTMPP